MSLVLALVAMGSLRAGRAAEGGDSVGGDKVFFFAPVTVHHHHPHKEHHGQSQDLKEKRKKKEGNRKRKGLGFGGWGGGGFWFPGGGVRKPKAKNRHWLPKHKNEKSKKSIKDKKTNSSKDLVPKKGKVRTTKDLIPKKSKSKDSRSLIAKKDKVIRTGDLVPKKSKAVKTRDLMPKKDKVKSTKDLLPKGKKKNRALEPGAQAVQGKTGSPSVSPAAAASTEASIKQQNRQATKQGGGDDLKPKVEHTSELIKAEKDAEFATAAKQLEAAFRAGEPAQGPGGPVGKQLQGRPTVRQDLPWPEVFFFTDPDVAPPYDDDPEANPDLFKTGWPEGFAAGKAKALHESKAAKAKSGKDGSGSSAKGPKSGSGKGSAGSVSGSGGVDVGSGGGKGKAGSASGFLKLEEKIFAKNKDEPERPEIDPATKSGYQVEYRGAKAMNKMRREEKQEERLENQVQSTKKETQFEDRTTAPLVGTQPSQKELKERKANPIRLFGEGEPAGAESDKSGEKRHLKNGGETRHLTPPADVGENRHFQKQGGAGMMPQDAGPHAQRSSEEDEKEKTNDEIVLDDAFNNSHETTKKMEGKARKEKEEEEEEEEDQSRGKIKNKNKKTTVHEKRVTGAAEGAAYKEKLKARIKKKKKKDRSLSSGGTAEPGGDEATTPDRITEDTSDGKKKKEKKKQDGGGGEKKNRNAGGGGGGGGVAVALDLKGEGGGEEKEEKRGRNKRSDKHSGDPIGIEMRKAFRAVQNIMDHALKQHKEEDHKGREKHGHKQ